jgi:hypothetical protein
MEVLIVLFIGIVVLLGGMGHKWFISHPN